MASKTSKTAKRVAAKPAKPRKTAPKSKVLKAAKPRKPAPKPKVLKLPKPAPKPRKSAGKANVVQATPPRQTAPKPDVHKAEEPRPSAPTWKVIKAAEPHQSAPTSKVLEAVKPHKTTLTANVVEADKPREAAPKSEIVEAAKPRLLSGGNPQVPKAEGNAPVQAYIAAMPDWKRDIGRRLDALITRAVPRVNKAVKWSSPFYGIEGQGWFLNFHCFTNYVKVAFFRGASLDPVPPGHSTSKNVRYLNIHETDALDEAQFAQWVKQAAALPGWKV